MCITYHYGWVSAGADGSGRKGVEGGTRVELFRAEVVRAVTQTAADGTALIPTKGNNDKQDVSDNVLILKQWFPTRGTCGYQGVRGIIVLCVTISVWKIVGKKESKQVAKRNY